MMHALLLAVRSQLRTGLTLDASNCDVTFDGRPPPFTGELFVAVHGNGQTNDAREKLDERLNVIVTLTMRANKVPFDRWGLELMGLVSTGFYYRAEQIRAYLHMAWAVVNAANATIQTAGVLVPDGSTIGGFREPLMFQSMSKPRMVGGDWFHAKHGRESGVVSDLMFAGARRMQPLGNLH